MHENKEENYQERFERRLYFVSEEVIPVHVSEEGMGLGKRTGGLMRAE